MIQSALPISKTALDRLGARLAAGEQVSDEVLLSLAAVVSAYQEVLDDVKRQLVELGFDATTRVKTTATLVDKLRRESRMRLSQVQDLAGARIIVANRPAQDEAAARIRGHFEAQGCACKEVDRRVDPRFGYRALHLVVAVGSILVEIQVRTDLEDTWAQIFERLADRWGRGIRYGLEPIDPDSPVRAGDYVMSRRQATDSLQTLASLVADFENSRGVIILLRELGERMQVLLTYVRRTPLGADTRVIADLPEEAQAGARLIATGAALAAPPAVRENLVIDPQGATMAALMMGLGQTLASGGQEVEEMLQMLKEQEQELRATLQVIASATDEGEVAVQ